MKRDNIKKAMLVLISIMSALVINVFADSRDQAKRMHDRLTGVPPSNAMLDQMQLAIDSGDSIQAALYAIDGAPGVEPSGGFYNVTLKNWAAPWTNGSQTPFAPLNDYIATVIGIVRDEIDFRQILSGDLLYVGVTPGIPAYSNADNTHYEYLEASGEQLGDSAVLQQRSQSSVTLIPPEGVAGVMTTRAAARAFFIDGTNRAMFRFTLLNHFCMDLEQLKDTSRPVDRIRQDVSRSPGLDSTLFLNQCVGCHSGMDPMAQAFAYHQYDYPTEEEMPGLSQEQREELGQMVYTPGVVQPKYHINENNFIQGYRTPNDHWTNYWRLGDNAAKIGWLNAAGNSSTIDLAVNSAYSEGDGAASLGEELANTEAFASCQVKKAFTAVCRREIRGSERSIFDGLVSNFKSSGYNMKQIFAEIANTCSSHL